MRILRRLGRIDDRVELLDGYLVAYLNLDRVIEIIRTEDEPKAVMMARPAEGMAMEKKMRKSEAPSRRAASLRASALALTWQPCSAKSPARMTRLLTGT